MRQGLVSLFVIGMFPAVNLFSQAVIPVKSLRYDEDYSFLENDSLRNFYPKIKFIPLSTDKKTFISYGGEMRFQYFYSKNEEWRDHPQDPDGFVLTRWLKHFDFHLGKYFRTFGQLQSSLANSRIHPTLVENNPLDVHQLFVDINPVVTETSKLTLRIGRQELLYGSQRIISVREGPNNRQSFDALRLLFSSDNHKTDVFYSNFVVARPNIFDDGLNSDVQLGGAYIVWGKVPGIKNIDLYYLVLRKKNTIFNDGTGKELRHSFGTRIWSSRGQWKYDIEGLCQFGKFANKHITAWTASINTSFEFSSATWKPQLGLKAELISGDKEKGDNKLQTFNPLFPRGAYFGLAALIGPANLIDVHPSVSFELSEKLSFDVSYDLFWRYSRNDGLYAVNVSLIHPDGNTSETKIGNQLSSALVYDSNGLLLFRGEFTWFNAGPYLKVLHACEDILFTGVTVQIKF